MSNCNLCIDQLLEPDPPEEFLVVNNNGSPAFFETGIYNIPINTSAFDITFATEKAGALYTFNEMSIENSSDPSPLTILAAITTRSITGFSVALTGVTDTANYRLRWEVEVKEV